MCNPVAISNTNHDQKKIEVVREIRKGFLVNIITELKLFIIKRLLFA